MWQISTRYNAILYSCLNNIQHILSLSIEKNQNIPHFYSIAEMHSSRDTNNNTNTMVFNNGISELEHVKKKVQNSIRSDVPNFQPRIRWPDLIVQLFLHVGAIYGLLFQFYKIKLLSLLWCKRLKLQKCIIFIKLLFLLQFLLWLFSVDLV